MEDDWGKKLFRYNPFLLGYVYFECVDHEMDYDS